MDHAETRPAGPAPTSSEAWRARRPWLIGFAILLGIYVVQRAVFNDGDFDGFHRAAQYVLETGELSVEKNVQRYLPTFQVFMVPLGLLPLRVAAALWLCFSLVSLWQLPRLTERLTGVTPRQQLPAWLIMAPIFVDNLILGQSGLVLLTLSIASLVWMREGRGVRGGLVLGLLGLFKILPLALFAVPVLLGRSRSAVAGLLLAVVLGTGFCTALVGWEETREAATFWATKTRAEQTPWALVANNRSLRHNNQGLGVVLARTFGDIKPAKAKNSVNITSFPLKVPWSLYGTLLAIAVALGLRTAWVVRRGVVGSDPGDVDVDGRADERHADRVWGGLCALVGLGMLFVSPIVWTHYFAWLFPALVLIVHRRAIMLRGGWAFVLAFAVPQLRGLGLHMFAALALYVFVAQALARRTAPPPAAGSGAANGRDGTRGAGDAAPQASP